MSTYLALLLGSQVDDGDCDPRVEVEPCAPCFSSLPVGTFDLNVAETGDLGVALTPQARRSGKGHMTHPKAALSVISGHFPEVGTDISGAQCWKT